MIVKIKSFKKPEFKRLLEYILNDENRLYNHDNKSFLITHNLKGRTLNKFVDQYQLNEKFRLRRRTDSVILTHEIISFHKDDSEKITVEKLEAIARQYINLRNPKGIFLAVPHFDKEHYHIHICTSGVEYRIGKSLRMSKAGFQKLKKDIQNYQIERYPELSQSLVAYSEQGIAKKSDKEYQLRRRSGRATKKEKLLELIEKSMNKSRNQDDFQSILQESGIELYKRRGKPTGIVFENLKFRFSKLGFDAERIEKLGISALRESEISDVRLKKGKTIIRNR